MPWIETTANGIRLRIDSVNWMLIQEWREHIYKPDDWEECKIIENKNGTVVRVGGLRKPLKEIVYKAHNPKWSDHYSRHNILIHKNGDIEDFSIENIIIKPTKGVRRY